MKTKIVCLLIGFLSGLFMAILGYENKTADGTVTIPEGCVFVVAVCQGSVNPPYLNGNIMQTPFNGTVAATGQLVAIGIHTSPFPTQQTLPFVLNGNTKATFIYMDDAVCARQTLVSGYSTTGQITGDLGTSTDDIVMVS